MLKYQPLFIIALLFQLIGVEAWQNEFELRKVNLKDKAYTENQNENDSDTNYVFISPYQDSCKFRYKINLHAHTTNRGDWYAYSPMELMKSARDYGFDAIAITDLPDAGGIVEDPGVSGILHIPGIEYGGTPHLIGLGIDSLTDSNSVQVQIDHIKQQGGLAYIPHPHWGNYDEKMLGELKDFDGIAVFNSLTWDVAVFDGRESEIIPFNERVIDALLSEGRNIAIMVEEDTKYEGPHYNPHRNEVVDYGHQLNTVWMMVCADLSPDQIGVNDILKAVKEKRFTSHARPLRSDPEPPNFVDISTDGLMLSVQLDKKSDIEFIIADGEVKKIVENSTEAIYKAEPSDKYVRVRVKYANDMASRAWTNAIFIDGKK